MVGDVAKLMKVMDDMCVKEDGKFERSLMHEMQSISWSQKIFKSTKNKLLYLCMTEITMIEMLKIMKYGEILEKTMIHE
jgi:hypothetical protein